MSHIKYNNITITITITIITIIIVIIITTAGSFPKLQNSKSCSKNFEICLLLLYS